MTEKGGQCHETGQRAVPALGLQTRIRQLESRLDNNALVQEGESPAEDPMELLRELEEDYAQLEELIARINRTNSTTEAGEGEDPL